MVGESTSHKPGIPELWELRQKDRKPQAQGCAGWWVALEACTGSTVGAQLLKLSPTR